MINLNKQAKEKAAMFIDYENLYYHLKEEYNAPAILYDVVTEVIRNLRNYISETLLLDTIIHKAYADFERLNTVPLGSLYLMGIDTHNVLGTEHKNAADMRLCVDLMEIVYTRQDINSYILIAGDRDYIPVVQHLRRQGKNVKVVAFKESLSGDLLEIIGKENLLEAKQFISKTTEDTLINHRYTTINNSGLKVIAKIELTDKVMGKLSADVKPTEVVKAPKYIKEEYQEITFNNVKKIENKTALECLKILLQFMRDNRLQEVWLSPFLRRLTDALPILADYERKEAINNLNMFGAISVQQKDGDNYKFSVIVVNYNHPTVIKEMP